MDDLDPRARIGAAMLDAAIDAYREPGATGMVALDLEQAQQGAIVALAMLLEADPDLDNPRAIRVKVEGIATQLRAQIKTLRDEADATGNRQWLIQPSNTH